MPKRPQHTVRMDELTWREFGEAVQSLGYDRSEVLRALIYWYLRRSPLPVRPARSE